MDQPVFSKTNVSVSPEQIRMHERLAIFLALIAGFIDATGLIKWKTYVSFMSGNTTQLGAAFSSDKWGVIITSATVISCFLLGIYAGTCLSLSKKLKNHTLPFLLVSGILILYTLVSCFYIINSFPSIAIIGFAMGIMNTIVTSVGDQKINTDFVTGTLNSLARNSALLSMSKDKTEKKQYRSNVIHLLLLWTGFLSGAFIAPFLLPLFGNWIFGIPAFLLLIGALWISSSVVEL